MGLEDLNCDAWQNVQGSLWKYTTQAASQSNGVKNPWVGPRIDVPENSQVTTVQEQSVPGGSWRPHLDLKVNLTRTHEQERCIQTYRVYIFWDMGALFHKELKTQVFGPGFGEEGVDTLKGVNNMGQRGEPSMCLGILSP